MCDRDNLRKVTIDFDVAMAIDDNYCYNHDDVVDENIVDVFRHSFVLLRLSKKQKKSEREIEKTNVRRRFTVKRLCDNTENIVDKCC